MKEFTFIILTISLLFSCNSTNENSKKVNRESSSLATPPIKLQVTTINKGEIPESIKVKGDVLIAKAWKDKNGENILISSRMGPMEESTIKYTEGEKYAEFYGAQYVKRGNEYELLWDIYDFERHCPYDLWIGNLPNSTQITDLDNDGITETTIAYKLTCRSDVSPSNMKLIMHENDTKMALRGTMILEMDKSKISDEFEYDLSKVDTTGLSEFDRIMELYGRYSNENDFKNQPIEFLNFAKESWKKLVAKDEFEQL